VASRARLNDVETAFAMNMSKLQVCTCFAAAGLNQVLRPVSEAHHTRCQFAYERCLSSCKCTLSVALLAYERCLSSCKCTLSKHGGNDRRSSRPLPFSDAGEPAPRVLPGWVATTGRAQSGRSDWSVTPHTKPQDEGCLADA